MADRPNYYLLLDLDPRERDWAVIQKRIEEKKKAWSKASNMGSPKKRSEARQYLAMLNDIIEVLKASETREEEAEKAHRQKHEEARQAQAAKEADLEDWIAILQDDGFCSGEQFEKLAVEFASILTAEALRQRLREAKIIVAEEGDDAKPFDDVLAGDIRRIQEQLGLDTLYQFLGLNGAATESELFRSAEKIEKELRECGKTDVVSSARSELAGICKTLFGDDQGKQRYERYLLLEIMAPLHDRIEAIGEGGLIWQRQIAKLVKMAVKRGAREEDARTYILAYARKRGWKIHFDRDPGPSPRETPRPRPEPEQSRAEESEPPSPQGLTVQSAGDGFQLFWDHIPAVVARTYRVLRKASAPPQDEGDGEILAGDHTGNRFSETRVPPGDWYYSVYAFSGQIPSSEGASSGPHRVVRARSSGKKWRLYLAVPVAVMLAFLAYVRYGGNQPSAKVLVALEKVEAATQKAVDFAAQAGKNASVAEQESAKAAALAVEKIPTKTTSDEAGQAAERAQSSAAAAQASAEGAKQAASEAADYSLTVDRASSLFSSLFLAYAAPATKEEAVREAQKLAEEAKKAASEARAFADKAQASAVKAASYRDQAVQAWKDAQQALKNQKKHPQPAPSPKKPNTTIPLSVPVPKSGTPIASTSSSFPRVVIVASGDPNLTGIVEQQLAKEFERLGYQAVSKGNLLSLSDLLQRKGDRVSNLEMLDVLTQDRIDILVSARIDRLEPEELHYLGRSSILNRSQVGFSAFLVPEQQGLGNGWRETVAYQGHNASERVENAVLNIITDVDRTLLSGWQGYLQKSGTQP